VAARGASPSASGATASAIIRNSCGRNLLYCAALVLFARKLVYRGILHDLLAGDLPGFLDDPREGPVLPGRLLLDLLQHFFGEVETLFSFIGTAHGASAFTERLSRPKL